MNFLSTSHLPCQEGDVLQQGKTILFVLDVQLQKFEVFDPLQQTKTTYLFSDWQKNGFAVLKNADRLTAIADTILHLALKRVGVDACIDFIANFKNGVIDNSKLLVL